MTQVLAVASECAPLVKTGGLADVVGALPAALAPLGVRIRTLLPGYPEVMRALTGGEAVWRDDDLFGGPARAIAASAAGLDLLVLDAPHLFDRPGSIYLGPDRADWPDNPRRFAALSWAAAEIAGGALPGWRPHVLHGHDWQAGLAAVYLRDRHPGAPVGIVTTIHNVAFQGLAPAHLLDGLRLPASGMTSEGFEYWGRIGALKAGLVWADAITTVSPTYAEELLTPAFGMGLDGMLRARQGDLTGILNGIDLDAWTPPFDAPPGKARPKADLRAAMGLGPADGPLCVVVSRLTAQKGLDLLLDALPRLLAGGGQLALLGTGERALEEAFEAAAGHADVAVRIGYDEALARQLVAGGDAILVPSRFEPCGLTQLYGLRFGTIPLVARTGGLADTVIPATPAGLWAGVATGLQVAPDDAGALARGLDRLCALYRDADAWTRMQRNAMRHPVGWDRSARDYAALYERLAAGRG